MTDTNHDNSPALGGRNARTGREPRLGGETALRHLVISLESDDWRTRQAAADRLRDLGDEALAILAGALHAPNTHTQRVAAQTLGLTGGEAAIAVLVDAAADSELLTRQDVVISLIQAITRTDDPALARRIVEAVLYRIAHDENRDLRKSAHKRLHRLRDKLMGILIRMLGHEDVGTSAAAWKLLHDSPLLQTGWSSNFELLWHLLDCLTGITSRYPDETLTRLQSARIELATGLVDLHRAQDKESKVRVKERIVAYGKSRGAELFRTVIKDANMKVREVAALGLGNMKDAQAAPPISEILLDNPPLNVSVAAARALIRIRRHAALPVIAQAIQQEADPNTRWQLVHILRDIVDDQCAAFLLEIAENDLDERVHFFAACTLALNLPTLQTTPEMQTRILRALASDVPPRDLIGWMTGSLCNLAEAAHAQETRQGALNALFALLHHEDPDARATTIRVVADLPAADAVQPLAGCLGDTAMSAYWYAPDWRIVRICDYAAYELQKIGTPEALAAVEAWRQSNRDGEV